MFDEVHIFLDIRKLLDNQFEEGKIKIPQNSINGHAGRIEKGPTNCSLARYLRLLRDPKSRAKLLLDHTSLESNDPITESYDLVNESFIRYNT